MQVALPSLSGFRAPYPASRGVLVLVLLVLIGLALSGCAPQTSTFDPGIAGILADAERVEILVLHPDRRHPDGMTGPGERDFYGYRVLGRKVVQEEHVRSELLDLVEDGVASSDGELAACFHPRHAMRVHAGKERADLVICFECLTIHAHRPGHERATIATSRKPEPAVSRLYRAQGLYIHGDKQTVTTEVDDSPVPLSDDVVAVLRECEDLQVFATHPYPDVSAGRLGPGDEAFHGYKVLRSGPLVNQGARGQLIELVLQGVRESDGTVAECFNPRHGIRARRGEDVVELLICYECLALQVFGPGGEQYASATTSAAVETTVSRIFDNAEASVLRR
ncbi:MAG: hypothetical protein GY711_24860 [bacterium]|nr:hypothetical protein [bacterium]